jgi:hypothetical protein
MSSRLLQSAVSCGRGHRWGGSTVTAASGADIHHPSLRSSGDVGNDTTVSRTFAKATLVIDPFILWSCYGNRQLEDRPVQISMGKALISRNNREFRSCEYCSWCPPVVRSGRVVAAQRQWRSNLDQPPSPLPPTDVGGLVGGVSRAVHAAAPAAGAGRRPGTDCSMRAQRQLRPISRRSLLSRGRTGAEAQRLSPSIERQSEWSFASRSYFVRALLRSLRRTRPVIAARDKGRRAR